MLPSVDKVKNLISAELLASQESRLVLNGNNSLMKYFSSLMSTAKLRT